MTSARTPGQDQENDVSTQMPLQQDSKQETIPRVWPVFAFVVFRGGRRPRPEASAALRAQRRPPRCQHHQ